MPGMASAWTLVLFLASQSCAPVASYAGPESYQPPGAAAARRFAQPYAGPESYQPPGAAVVRYVPPAPQPPGVSQPLVRYDQPDSVEEPQSREDILGLRDQLLRESKANVEAELRRAEEEFEAARHSFLLEVDKQKEEHLVYLEQSARQRLQDFEAQAAARTREVEAAGEAYAARIEQQSKTLLTKSFQQELRRAHAEATVRMDKEEGWAREELEQLIRTAYDGARLPSGAISDPSIAIQQARSRYETQMQELAAKRSGLEKDMRQQMQMAEQMQIWGVNPVAL